MNIIKIVEEDNVPSLDAALNNGLDLNHHIKDAIPLLSFALKRKSEKIAAHLIKRGAEINELDNGYEEFDNEYQEYDFKKAPLFYAFCYCSLETCQLLINYGPNIFRIGIKDETYFRRGKTYTIFNLLSHSKVNFEKKKFIAQYLINRFDKSVLEIAVKENCPLKGLMWLIANGAYIPPNIGDIAVKSNNKQIIDFFHYQHKIRNQLIQHDDLRVTPIIDIIHAYSYGGYSYGVKDKEKVESDEESFDQLWESIVCSNDLQFVHYYLSNNGDPNLTDGIITLLCLSIIMRKEDIAILLVHYGADVNLPVDFKCKNLGIYKDLGIQSPLSLAITGSLSLNLVKELLKKGADINNLLNIENNVCNLTTILSKKWVSINDEKVKFMIDYLFKMYGDRVLNYIVADRNASIEIIKYFIKLGAKVYPETIEIAIKTKVPTNVIGYLQSILQIDEFSDLKDNFPPIVKTYGLRKRISTNPKSDIYIP